MFIASTDECFHVNELSDSYFVLKCFNELRLAAREKNLSPHTGSSVAFLMGDPEIHGLSANIGRLLSHDGKAQTYRIVAVEGTTYTVPMEHVAALDV